MKNKIIILLFSIFYISSHYQDIIINNRLLTYGSFECESRYATIKEFLKNYNRPFSVLDLGASEGYFSFKIANDFKSTCILVEGNYAPNSQEEIADRLEDLVSENTDLENIIYLKKYVTISDLKILSECEHFDVILALNFIHHFGSNWNKVADLILNLGDYVLIETPSELNQNAGSQEILKDIHDYLKLRNHKILGKFPPNREDSQKDTLYLIKTNKNNLQRINWDSDILPDYNIRCDFNNKFLVSKSQNCFKNYPMGLNLLTFKRLNGVWPKMNEIEENILNNFDIKLTQDSFSKFYIQGKNIEILN